MVQTEWVDFSILDMIDDEEQVFTKEKFEEMVGEIFEAVELGEDGFPKHIWMTRNVFTVITRYKMLMQTAIVGVPRNWEGR